MDTRETQLPIGPLIAAIGGILLIVSLFVDWYDSVTGYTVFEFLDLLLTGLALATLFVLASAMGALRTPVRPGLLLGIGVLALGGAALMVAGAILSSARIALSIEPRDGGRAAPTVTRTDEPPTRTDEAPTVVDEPPPRP